MWFGLSRKPRPASRTRPPARRLAVELLEDRLTPSTGGLLDPTFGSGGHVLSSFTNNTDQANAVVAQPDGKIVIAGYTQVPGSATGLDFLVARYNADGSLDSSFGSGGHTATDFGSTSKIAINDSAFAVALQPQADGTSKIVVAGTAGVAQKKGVFTGVGVARYNANGTLDTTFGTNGRVVTNPAMAYWLKMAVDGSGRIVVAGRSGGMAALVRYTPNGALDTSFGTGGVLITNISTGGIVDVAVQPDGKIVLATGNTSGFITARFNTNGTADPTFGNGGMVTTPFRPDGTDGGIGGVAVQGDGKIVIDGQEGSTLPNPTNEIALFRYNGDGSLDATFGTGGAVAVPADGGLNVAIALQADGKIIASGNLAPGHFAALRVNPDGSVDTGYGTGGVATFAFEPGALERAMALEPDGRLLLAGYEPLNNPNTGTEEVALVRFLGSAPQVGSFAASPNPVTSGSGLTLTASNISDGNPNSTVTQVAFYYIDGTGTQQVLGYGTADGLGNWVLSFTVNLAPGSYTLYAQAEDGYGAFGDPLALTLTVQ